jgi:peptide/nickel transport system permease protein
LQSVPVIVLVTFATFSLILLLPGDPIQQMYAQGGALTPEQEEHLKHELGLDRPLPIQYARWVVHALTGNFGHSTQTRLPVSEILSTSVPVTLQLGLFGLVLGLLIAVPTGIISAVRSNSIIDRLVTVISIGGVAMPDFLLAVFLILVFSSRLHLLPATGFVSIATSPTDALRFMILPGTILAFGISPVISRQVRSSMLEVLRQDFVRTARAKGLQERRVILTHALRNAILPSLTVLGLLVGRLLAGAVIIEQIFAIPGMGRVFVGAILARDFPVVQATVLMTAVMVIVANLITDVAYAVLDPRIRY